MKFTKVAAITVLWACLLQGVWTSYPLSGDSICYYYWARYFLLAIGHGEYPLWNPFHFWGGQDNFDTHYINEFNPFTYLPLGLNTLGVPFHLSYLISTMSYFILTCLGFYYLTLSIWKDHRWALLAYTLILFSSLTAVNLFQSCAVLIITPIIWFTYFVVSYTKTRQVHNLWGATFALMIMLTTYIPFYFLTTALSFSLFGLLIYFKEIPSMIVFAKKSFQEHRWIWALSFVSLVVATLPELLWYWEAHTSEYFFTFRHGNTEGQNILGVHIEGVNLSGIANYLSTAEIFSWHDISNAPFLYLSIPIYFCIILSALNPVTQRTLWVFLSGLFIFFIAATDATPVHSFLYKHIYFSQLFRNTFFFIFILIPIFIFFALDQLRNLLENLPQTHSAKIRKVLFLVTALIAILFYLQNFAPLIWTTFAALISFTLFLVVIIIAPSWRQSKWGWLILFGLFLLEPIHVYSLHAYDNLIPYSLTEGGTHPEFTFIRPSRLSKEEPGYKGYLGHFKKMKEESGFINADYLGTTWTYRLQEKILPEILENYTRYKFFLYDRVQPVTYDEVGLEPLKNSLKELKNTALLAGLAIDFSLANHNIPPHPTAIENNSPDFQVEKFGLNFIQIKTNLSEDKFLVYNDSFHDQWHAKLNNRVIPIYRANYAFKGIFLPKGENHVEFRYGYPFREWLYKVIILYFLLSLFLLLTLFFRRKAKHDPNS